MSPSEKAPSRLTVLQLEEYLRREIPPGISSTQIYNHIRRAGLKLDKARRVDVAKFMQAYMDSKAGDTKGREAGAGDGQDARKHKVRLECMILQVKLDQLRSELIPVSDHLSELREFAGWTRDALAQWVSEVKVLTGDARVVGEAERLRDRTLERMRSSAESAKASA